MNILGLTSGKTFFFKFSRKVCPYSVTGMTWLTVNIKTTGRSYHQDNPIALRKAKIVYNFGLSECNRVKVNVHTLNGSNSAILSYFQ